MFDSMIIKEFLFGKNVEILFYSSSLFFKKIYMQRWCFKGET